jgi:predicted lipoprotein with Yx(FWY)xxD motif
MTQRKPITFLASTAVAAAAALAVAACGSGGGGSASTATSKPATGGTMTVSVAKTGLGQVLVDAQGRTLYLFKKDSGTKSACVGACAAAWPPLRSAGKPTAGSGASASEVATTARSDGKPEVTYNGHPLYLFTGDKQPGDTNGQGVSAFGGGWFALSPAGNEVSGPAQSTSNGY